MTPADVTYLGGEISASNQTQRALRTPQNNNAILEIDRELSFAMTVLVPLESPVNSFVCFCVHTCRYSDTPIPAHNLIRMSVGKDKSRFQSYFSIVKLRITG